MAMLAETRKKQKWSLNPRGSAWMNDSSKLGEKLLRKMGWSEGQGLGLQQQGITEHIKVKVKNDSKGLGFKENDQVWVEVENDFANLLSKLSSQSETPTSDSQTPAPIESVNRSLEEKSKKSKARVHYQKFTRGKDLSRYSKRDLECIFGVSSKSAESKHEENKNFVPSGNMEEYFNKKKLKKNTEVKDTDNDISNSVVENEETSTNEPEAEEIVSKKKKNKKAKKRKHEENTELIESSELQVQEETKKKKKRKHVDVGNESEVREEENNVPCQNEDQLEIAIENEVSEPKIKKKNKKKKSKLDKSEQNFHLSAV